MPIILTVFFGVFSIIGVVCVAFLVVAPESVERYRPSWFPKLFSVLARVGCGLGGFFSGARGHWPSADLPNRSAQIEDFFKDQWNWAMISAVAAWVLWETVQALGEWRRTQLKSTTRALDKQVMLRTALITSLRRCANEKKKRIGDGISEPTNGKPTSCPGTCAVLRPAHQMRMLLEGFALCLKHLHPKPNSPDAAGQNFRLCLYVDEGDSVLRPWLWFDMNDVGADVSSFRPQPQGERSDRFDLKNKRNPAVAVQAIQRGKLLIIPNCDTPPQGVKFEYFDANQENLLKSLFAYPILEFRTKDGKVSKAAIVVGTNVPEYFREADRMILGMFGEEFSSRLNLEAHVLALIGKK